MTGRRSPLRRVSASRLVIALLAIGMVVASVSPVLGPLRGLARVLLIAAVILIVASYARELLVRRRGRC